MSNIITLPQAAARIAREGEVIRMGSNFETFEDFKSYFDIHYKPILEELQKEWAGASDARRFLASDLLEIFA